MDALAYVPGDALPGAPALAARGPRPVGVTTLTLSNPYQIDVLGSLATGSPLRGALVALGAGLDVPVFDLPPFADPLRRELLDDLALDTPFHDDLVDAVTSRVRAAVLLAPYGGDGAWTERALARVRTPLFLAAGSEDDIAALTPGGGAGYAAVRRVFEGATSADRWLLTFQGARHNVGSNPPPDALAATSHEAWWRYADPVWDVRRIVNVLQHHLTAFLGTRLRGLPLESYLEGAVAARGVSWPGYPPRSTVGLRLRRRHGETAGDHPGHDDDVVRDLTAAA